MVVLKHNDSFAVLDDAGNAHEKNEKDHHIADGIFHRDTRILSRAVLTVNGETPAVLSSGMINDNTVFQAFLKRGGTHVTRTVVLWEGALYEKTEIKNTGEKPAKTGIEWAFGADFKDLFETRGWARKGQGRHEDAPDLNFRYTGLDNVTRVSGVSFSLPPVSSGFPAHTARFTFDLKPGETQVIYSRAGKASTEPVTAAVFEARKNDAAEALEKQLSRRPEISSSNPDFDKWVHQDAIDIALLTTEFDTGPFPCAGIPWYSTPFGRDGIITAFELLWQDPDLAKGVLGYLAKHQAKDTSLFHGATPGRIMHEIRLGEMAGAGEVPHAPYYGTVDATPLFISLAGAYFERTGDKEFLRQLWPHIERALEWIDRHGDVDGDGFVEYVRDTEAGLSNQGWKDSNDSISHADGRLAPGSIALCEVQGYVYAAKLSAADIAESLGKNDIAAELRDAAEKLKEKFNKVFWSEELGTYALALDGDKKPCLVSTSNPGHLLFSGIVPEDRAKKVADRLMSPDMFSGWGVRTLSENEKRYEPSRHPEGYHNGTVWTHDTAIAGAGFMRCGMEDKASTLLTALFEAAKHFPQMRLPELFGGLKREEGQAPAPYPVACNPQAWASGSGSLLLQAMLGITVDGRSKTVTVSNPQLPPWLDTLTIKNLSVGSGSISLEFRRVAGKTNVSQLEKSADVTFKTHTQPLRKAL